MVTDVIDLLSHSIDKRINIEFESDDGDILVRGDVGRLQNMLLNLALNARDAMPDGGELRFSAHRCDPPENVVNGLSEAPHGCLKITVADTGVGIDPDVAPRVFEPFFTTKKAGQGTGLGLTSAYGCVQGHGGAIEIHDAAQGGTVVEVVLPLAKPDTVADADGGDRASGRFNGLVLVVDDEEAIREFAEESLQALGLTTVGCSDGAEGVEVFGRRHRDIRLVLLDVVMPRLDGVQALRRMLEIDPSVPVVLSSGYPGETGIGHEIPDGAAAFLGKPYRMGDLQKLVERFLD
jgi:CheY-like chemotaxis protein